MYYLFKGDEEHTTLNDFVLFDCATYGVWDSVTEHQLYEGGYDSCNLFVERNAHQYDMKDVVIQRIEMDYEMVDELLNDPTLYIDESNY